jgi:sugar phosphate isomerase/epimerase
MEVAVCDAYILYRSGFATGVEGLRKLGISALEVAIDKEGTVRSLTSDARLDLTTPQGLEAFRGELKEHGIRVPDLLCSQDFLAEDRDAQIRWVVQAVRAAEALGIAALRIDSNMKGGMDLPLEERIRVFADAVREILAQTAGSKVALGIENHGRIGNDPAWMRGVIESVGNARLGVTLDVGNWYWYGHPLSRVYEIYKEFGPHVKATHVKNINYPEEIRETQREVGYEYGKFSSPLEEGNIQMARVAAILKECGFDGALTIEDESVFKVAEEERGAVLKRDVDHLKSAIR